MWILASPDITKFFSRVYARTYRPKSKIYEFSLLHRLTDIWYCLGLAIDLLIDPAVLLLGIYSKESTAYTHTAMYKVTY